MNFDFNNVSPVFTFLICDVKAQRPNVKKKKRQVPFYGFQSLPLGFYFFKSFVDIKKLSCIRNGITSVCFALSSLNERWLVHVNRCKGCRSFKVRVWWTGQGYPALIMFSRQFFGQLAPTSLQFMVLFKCFLFQSMGSIKEASRPCTFLWPKLHGI